MRQLSLSFYDRFISVLTPSFNPLSPDSDENEISHYIINTCSNIQVMRIKEVITKDKVS